MKFWCDISSVSYIIIFYENIIQMPNENGMKYHEDFRVSSFLESKIENMRTCYVIYTRKLMPNSFQF